jgi:hypothetical protein
MDHEPCTDFRVVLLGVKKARPAEKLIKLNRLLEEDDSDSGREKRKFL